MGLFEDANWEVCVSHRMIFDSGLVAEPSAEAELNTALRVSCQGLGGGPGRRELCQLLRSTVVLGATGRVRYTRTHTYGNASWFQSHKARTRLPWHTMLGHRTQRI